MDVDAVGLPKRCPGERFLLNGRIFTIIENLGLAVICPCPDSLHVRYEDNDEDAVIENDILFERIN